MNMYVCVRACMCVLRYIKLISICPMEYIIKPMAIENVMQFSTMIGHFTYFMSYFFVYAMGSRNQ